MRVTQKINSLKTRAQYTVAKTANKMHPKYIMGVRATNRMYAKSLRTLRVDRPEKTLTAVVLHLYYTESWPLFAEKLSALQGHPYDLFITLPEHNVGFAPEIYKLFPRAYVVVTPNRGRDVLPFLRVLPVLVENGYQYVLKLHTKKSTHRTDGSEWLGEMIDGLLPQKSRVVNALYETLKDPATGVVGPSGQYVSLSVNFEANGMHMTNILKRLYGKKVSYDVLQLERSKHGFFAGTMFWARLDAIAPILKYPLKTSRFESEKGQIDATLAHAIERVLCLIPQVNQKKLYEVGVNNVRPTAYDSGHVPDWSAVYIGPKPKG